DVDRRTREGNAFPAHRRDHLAVDGDAQLSSYPSLRAHGIGSVLSSSAPWMVPVLIQVIRSSPCTAMPAAPPSLYEPRSCPCAPHAPPLPPFWLPFGLRAPRPGPASVPGCDGVKLVLPDTPPSELSAP